MASADKFRSPVSYKYSAQVAKYFRILKNSRETVKKGDTSEIANALNRVAPKTEQEMWMAATVNHMAGASREDFAVLLMRTKQEHASILVDGEMVAQAHFAPPGVDVGVTTEGKFRVTRRRSRSPSRRSRNGHRFRRERSQSPERRRSPSKDRQRSPNRRIRVEVEQSAGRESPVGKMLPFRIPTPPPMQSPRSAREAAKKALEDAEENPTPVSIQMAAAAVQASIEAQKRRKAAMLFLSGMLNE